MKNPVDYGDVVRRFSTQFKKTDLRKAMEEASGPDKAFFNNTLKDKKAFDKFMSEQKFQRGGVKESSTRGPTDAEIRSMFKEGKIDRDEFDSLLKFNRNMREKNQPLPRRKPKPKLKKGGFPDLTGDGKVSQADILKGRGVKLAKGGMKKSRNGNIDYRKSGMFYVGGMASKITPINKGKK